MSQHTPELIDDREFKKRLDLFPSDWTTATMRPATVLAALMQQAPGDGLAESIEEVEPLHAAVAYAAECINAEDTYVLNCINSEGITYQELAARLGVSRSRGWDIHKKAITRLRALLLNHPPVRERLGMQPTWNAAAMEVLVGLAGYEDTHPDAIHYPLAEVVVDIYRDITLAVAHLNAGKERAAVEDLECAARSAIIYLKTLGQWKLIDMHRLLCSKQNDYGHGNILKFGMVGVVVRCSDKGERLLNLTREGVAPRNEALLDTFFDIVGYAVIARMLKNETFELELDPDSAAV